jgi:serine/threonine-protein kinase
LGFGGMGAVYQALQRNMQRDVAVKVIPSHDPTTTARFEREALTISKLHHPNTVTVFDYGKTGQGMLFLAMEMLSGHTLSNLIETQGPLTPNRTVHIACQVARSLYEAHQSDIVHRDVKPDNIFLIEVDDDPDFVKVLDFGIAKIVRGEDDVELTGTGRIIGTPKYMSPEQILAEKVDHRSDIYSLGCIVFEMLCGSPPFQDTSTTKLMLAHAHQAPPTFSERLPNQALASIPGPLEQVVRRALSKSPMQRHRTIDEFRIELEAALEATDHELRISELRSGSETQRAPSIQEYSGQSSVTDSSDLLSQHSSQTLAKLKRPTGTEAPPTAEVDDRDKRTEESSKTPVYAILAILAVIAGLVAYMALVPGDDTEQAVAVPLEVDDGAQVDQQAAPAKEGVEEAEDKAFANAKDLERVEVMVVSEPAGAHVYEEGRSVGKTPLTKKADAGATLSYTFELDGYVDKDARHLVDPDGAASTFSVTLEKKAAPKRTRRPARSRPTRSKPAATKTEETKAPEEAPEEVLKPEKRQINIEMVDDDGPNEGPNVEMLD